MSQGLTKGILKGKGECASWERKAAFDMCHALVTEALTCVAFPSHDTGLGHVLCSVYTTKHLSAGGGTERRDCDST